MTSPPPSTEAENDAQTRKAYLALGIGIVFISFSAILIRWADAPGLVTGFYRMFFAALGMALAVVVQRLRRRPLRTTHSQHKSLRHGLLAGVAAGLFFGGDIAFWTTGVMLSGPVNPTLMGNTAPLWVGLGAMLFLGEKLGRVFWIGLGLILVGAIAIVGEDLQKATDIGIGTLYGLLAGFFYGAYFIVMQVCRRYLSTFDSGFITASVSAMALLLGVWLFHFPLTGYPFSAWLSFLGLGIGVQILGQFTIGYALGYLPASFVAPATLGQPVGTAVLSYLLLGTPFTGLQLGGGAIILAGIYTVHLGRMAGR